MSSIAASPSTTAREPAPLRAAPEPVLLTPARREEAVQALGAAFAQDPLILWMSRAADYPYIAFDQVIDPYLHTGASWILNNGAGALLGAPPGMPKPKADIGPSLVWLLLRRYGPRTLVRGVWYELYSATFPPKQRHYYVYAIGVKPAFQGRGWGARLMQPILGLADAEGVPVYLESANERNLTFYQRLGFRIIRETRVPLRGPRLWLMLRAPQPATA